MICLKKGVLKENMAYIAQGIAVDTAPKEPGAITRLVSVMEVVPLDGQDTCVTKVIECNDILYMY